MVGILNNMVGILNNMVGIFVKYYGGGVIVKSFQLLEQIIWFLSKLLRIVLGYSDTEK